jgi:hypothetical protein
METTVSNSKTIAGFANGRALGPTDKPRSWELRRLPFHGVFVGGGHTDLCTRYQNL